MLISICEAIVSTESDALAEDATRFITLNPLSQSALLTERLSMLVSRLSRSLVYYSHHFLYIP